MFTTSFAVFALSTVISLGGTTQPSWHTDYRAAIHEASQFHKPVAVFIAKTPGDVLKGIPTESQRVLQSGYIALMVTTDTEAGRRLADRFELTEGLVISDSTGSVQAFRTPGSMPTDELAKTLERFVDPNRVVRTTETPVTAVAPPVVVVPSPVVSAPAAPIVVQYAPPVVPTITAPAVVCRT